MKTKTSLLLCNLVLMAAVATPRINAQQPESPRSGASPVVNAEDIPNVVSYWTPERLSSAKPMDLIEVDPNGGGFPARKSDQGVQGFAAGQKPLGGVATERSEPLLKLLEDQGPVNTPGFNYVYPFTTSPDNSYNSYPDQTVGRLFFTLDGNNYSCSASVIRPHTLITARHCVFSYNDGHWASNEVFYPALYNGSSNGKYGGAWYGRVSATWTSGASTLDYDIGFIQLFDHNRSGCGGSSGTPPIENYTGFLGYTWNGDYSQRQWALFGYPAQTNGDDGNPFNGNWMIRSDAATGQLNSFGYNNTIEVGSDLTGGASGGPWIIGYNPGNGTTFTFGSNSLFITHGDGNYDNGLNSFKFTRPDHGLAINGPQFQTYNFLNLLNFYNGIACP